MEKAYDPHKVELELYKAWEKAGLFKPNDNKKAFTIAIPPPNVTGTLHLGHAIMLVFEDAMIRWHRMLGESSLWVPGTDHAAIATESVVLKNLGKKSREEFTREEFMKKCWDWTGKSHAIITNQIKKMGASCDWSREAFTFDDKRNFAVNYIFKKLQEKGLIVRGKRMINWSVGAQSVLADDEVEHKDTDAFLYLYKYFFVNDKTGIVSTTSSKLSGLYKSSQLSDKSKLSDEYLIVATTRPETMFGDTAVAVNPKDKRYKNFIGKKVRIPFSNIQISVIADEHVDMKFGTGCLKVTPAHDKNDFEIGKKHNLETKQVIGFDGKMIVNEFVPKQFQGLTRENCRKELIKESEFFTEKKAHKMSLGICYRSHTVIEPMLSKQWFIAVEKEFIDDFTGKKTTLKKLTQEAVRKNHVQVVPKRFEKIYFNWIDNLRDWCISRQIWWGHRIPVWYDQNDNEHFQKIQNLIFARHGESEGNAKGFMQGVTDTKLTEEGKKQAKKLGEILKDKKITKIICSPLSRAKETAEIVAKELKLNIEIWDELHEINAGKLETQMFDEVFKEKKPTYHNIGKWLFAEKSAENLKSFLERAEKALQKLKKEKDENILIVSHGMFIAGITAINEKIDDKNFIEFLKKWNLHKADTYEIANLKAPEINHNQKITFLRHSETEGNIKYLIGCDYPLTKKGKEETKKLIKELQDRKISKIIASNSKSAKETAEMIGKEIKIEPEYWTEFTGVNFGKITGQKGQKSKLSIEIAIENKTGETPKDIFTRVKKGWEKLQKIKTDGEILVIGHRTIFTALDLIREKKDEKNFLKNREGNEQKPHGIWNEIEISETLKLRQDEDTLDTWFSAALWPFSILGWPNQKDPDFQKFYPTDVLETGHDILFFWVARMIMFGRFATGKYPFHTVYLHGMVRDKFGQKMSKSKPETCIDPLDMIKKYGTDALRLSLITGSTPGNDVNLGEEKIAGCRNFCNKLWNISRFILSQESGNIPKNPETDLQKWLTSKVNNLIEKITKDFENYRFGQAADKLWDFTWNEFADWAIEAAKAENLPETNAILKNILKDLLKLWHPFIPYITEEVWKQFPKEEKMLIISDWPKANKQKFSYKEFDIVREIISKIRSLRAEKKVEPAKKIKAFFDGKNSEIIKNNEEIVKFLARIEEIKIGKKPQEICVTDFVKEVEINLPLAYLIDEKVEKQRIEKEIKEAENLLVSLEAKLSNKSYVQNAPTQIVEETRKKAEECKLKIEKLKNEN